jgi:hypothetical protein
MRETLLDGWSWLLVFVVVGFLLAYVWDSLFPSRDEPTYYWEMDGYFPKYPLPPDGDEPEK